MLEKDHIGKVILILMKISKYTLALLVELIMLSYNKQDKKLNMLSKL